MHYALFAHALHHAVDCPHLETTGRVNAWKLDVVKAECAAAHDAIKMRVKVVVVVIVVAVGAVIVAVAHFVTDAARAVLDDVDEMLVGK